jgi:hypothetical protein
MRRALGFVFMHVVIAKPLHTFARHALRVAIARHPFQMIGDLP